jgi:aryl-alcohol dehydrogenase-like predicted oxidoreductase
VARIGAGTWQWGDRLGYWGYGREYTAADVSAAYRAARAAGVTLFDTAEVYGLGRSERMLGEFAAAEGPVNSPPVIATKFFPFPWRLSRKQLRRALRNSLRRLGAAKTDLYQTHFPLPPRSVSAWVDEIGAAVEEGLVKAVGVSNYGAESLRRAHETLARRGIPLASDQVGYSLLNRKPERNGVIDACRELGVTVIAYGPLGEGVLTGKYETRNLPLRRRVKMTVRRLPVRTQFIGLMREIGESHGGATPAQVALNWCCAKGAVPIAGIKTAAQAEDNFAALRWELAADEVTALDEASMR